MSKSILRAGAKRRILVTFLLIGLAFLTVSMRSGETTRAETASNDPRIIGGTDVPNGKYPFMAAVLDMTRPGSTAYDKQYCGGTLIDHDSVLTAAHCVSNKSPSNLRVTVGRTYLNSTQGQMRSVSRINVHYSYNNPSFDVAVLKLSSSVTRIRAVQIPATTANGFEASGYSLTAAGWGSVVAQPASGDTSPSRKSMRMREAQVPVVSDATADRIYPSYVPSIMVAAGRTGKDTCQGDSGGPIFKTVSTSAGLRYYQVGITSFGKGCGATGYPGVYAETNNPSIRGFIYYWAAR